MVRMRTLDGLVAAVALSTLLGSSAIAPALHAAGGATVTSTIHGMSANDLQVMHNFHITVVPISPEAMPPRVSAQQIEAKLLQNVHGETSVAANYVLYTNPYTTPRTVSPAERAADPAFAHEPYAKNLPVWIITINGLPIMDLGRGPQPKGTESDNEIFDANTGRFIAGWLS